MSSKTKTERLIETIEGFYYRIDNGQSGGRNASATDATLDWRWNQLREALEEGGFEELDGNDRLAAKYSKIERRRALGARVAA